MLIEFRAADRLLGLKALGIYAKGVEAAQAACDKVFVDTMAMQEATQRAVDARSWIASLNEFEPGEVRDVDMPIRLTVTLRTATSVYLTSLSKLAEKEGDLLVPLDNTQELMSHLQSLADRLNGQMELGNVVGLAMKEAVETSSPDAKDDRTATISVNGGPAIPMQQFERGMKSMSKRVR